MKTAEGPATLPAPNTKHKDPFQDPAYVARCKAVLPTLEITKAGAAVTGEPAAPGEYEVKRKAKRSTDVRSGAEICDLLARLYPGAGFKWLGALLAVCLAVTAAWAVDGVVAPQNCTFTVTRGEAVAAVSGTYYKGATLLATNCIALVSAGVTQDLTNVDIDVTISDTITSTNFAGTVQVAASGTFWFACSLTNAFLNQANIQVKLTDSGGNSYIYPWKTLNMRDPLE
jgi:hypothetical protein